MCCSELIKRKISQCFNREATVWIEKNYQDVSIDKIYKIQFSTRLAFLAHCNPVRCTSNPNAEENAMFLGYQGDLRLGKK